jgi:hypothetical protein
MRSYATTRRVRTSRAALAVTCLPLVAAGAALALVSGAHASEAPTLRPGTTAVVAGTHVRCVGAAYSVLCGKTGGLTATIAQRGAVRVTRRSGTPQATKHELVLHRNDGFVISGTRGVTTYCHVYVAGKPVIDCALDYPTLNHTSVGFDMSDDSVVVVRYDEAGGRHELRTIKQP